MSRGFDTDVLQSDGSGSEWLKDVESQVTSIILNVYLQSTHDNNSITAG